VGIFNRLKFMGEFTGGKTAQVTGEGAVLPINAI
jgi:hypothetical protein